MPLTITIDELSQAVELTVAGSPDPSDLGILTRDLGVATAYIEYYADDAPADVKNEAAILMVGHFREAPWYSRRPQNTFKQSGAMALLAPWHVLVSAVVT